MKKAKLLAVTAILMMIAIAEYFALFALPCPKFISDIFPSLELQRAAVALYTPVANWDSRRDELIASGVNVGILIEGKKRIFSLSAEKAMAKNLDETTRRHLRLTFSRGNAYLGVKSMEVPLEYRVWRFEDDPETKWALMEITDAVDVLRKRGAEVKYVDLDSEIAGWYNFTELGIGCDAEIFTIVAKGDSERVLNPFTKVYSSPYAVKRGNLITLLGADENGAKYHEADLSIDEGALGAGVFTFAKKGDKRYPVMIGIIAKKVGDRTWILPIERVRSKILLTPLAKDEENLI